MMYTAALSSSKHSRIPPMHNLRKRYLDMRYLGLITSAHLIVIWVDTANAASFTGAAEPLTFKHPR